MSIYMSKVCSKAFRGLYSIRQVRKYLLEDATNILVHFSVTSRLDCCNSMLLAFQNTNMIGCRGFLTQLPATPALYTRLVTTRQSFIIYIGYQCLTGFNLKYCYLFTQLSLVLPLST